MSGFEISLAIGGVTLVVLVVMVAIFFATRPQPKQFFSQPQPQLSAKQKARYAFDAIEDVEKDMVAEQVVGALGRQGASERFQFLVRAANSNQPQPQPGSPGWNQPPFSAPVQGQGPTAQSWSNP